MSKRSKKRISADSSVGRGKSPICFVIMPFGGWLDDYYEAIYCPAITSAGLDPHRADDLFRPSTIVTDVWNYTKRAKVLLADLSGKNPNVFYELGLAHALAKPAILVAETMDDIPFDLRALRVLLYDKNAPDWGRVLREKIQSALKEVLEAPAEAVLPAFLDVKSAGAKPVVSEEQKDVIEIKQELDLLRRELRSRDVVDQLGRKTDIGPAQADKMIRSLLSENVPEAAIVETVTILGPPRLWITQRLKRIRDEGLPSPRADDED